MLGIKVIAAWWAISTVIALGQWLAMNKALGYRIAGALILLLGLAYPTIGAMGIASATIGNRVLADLSVSDSLVEKYRQALESDTLSFKARSALSKVLAYDHFWETGVLIPYLDEEGRSVGYEPNETDQNLAMSAIKAKAVFGMSLALSFTWISAVPIGIFLGYLLGRNGKGVSTKAQ